MIIIRYTGGLGNQMFQYAMNIILKQKFPENKIYADLSRYDLTNEHDGFDLLKYFNIEINIVDILTLKKIAPINYWCIKLHISRLLHIFPVGKIEKINEMFEKKDSSIGIIPDYSATNYNKDAFSLNLEKINVWHYKGNWINQQYWQGYEHLILNNFIFKEEILSQEDEVLIKEMKETESIGIHIRKGDYTGSYLYDICNEKYYSNAMKKIISLINNKSVKVYVFAETENLELDFLKKIDYKIVSHPTQPGIDMWLMSKCRYNIIANSTFSFWSAFLNRYQHKIVIAPRYIYRREVLVNFSVPSDWIQIDNIEKVDTFNGEKKR